MLPEGNGPTARAVTLLLGLLAASCALGGDRAGGAAGERAGGARALVGASRARVVFPDGRAFLAEVADTPPELSRGLMFRDHLGPGTGMVFVFEEPGLYSFWMKNTRISLDIVWLDSGDRVVHIERQVPPCEGDPCARYEPLRPAAWVLEVGAGQAAGLRLGERLLVGPEAAGSGP